MVLVWTTMSRSLKEHLFYQLKGRLYFVDNCMKPLKGWKRCTLSSTSVPLHRPRFKMRRKRYWRAKLPYLLTKMPQELCHVHPWLVSEFAHTHIAVPPKTLRHCCQSIEPNLDLELCCFWCLQAAPKYGYSKFAFPAVASLILFYGSVCYVQDWRGLFISCR